MVSTPTTSTTPTYMTDARHDPRRADRINVGQLERLLSVIGGGSLVTYGLKHFSVRGIVLAAIGGELIRRGITGQDYLYRFLDVNTVSDHPATLEALPENNGIAVRRAMTIEGTPEDLYRFWRDLEMAPQYMQMVKSVQVVDDKTSHWVAQLPTGQNVEWDSEITEDLPNQSLAWKTVSGAPLAGHAGRVRFVPAPDTKGTTVISEIYYYQPAGAPGVSLAKLLGRIPEQFVRENLRRFKQLMEAGEIPTLSEQPVGEGQYLSSQKRKK